jgi:hypothetical protein
MSSRQASKLNWTYLPPRNVFLDVAGRSSSGGGDNNQNQFYLNGSQKVQNWQNHLKPVFPSTVGTLDCIDSKVTNVCRKKIGVCCSSCRAHSTVLVNLQKSSDGLVRHCAKESINVTQVW